MVMTVMSVATPMVNPSTVREARSLCARSALKHWAKLSLIASMAAEQEFSHYITRFCGIATCRLADEATTVSKERTKRAQGKSHYSMTEPIDHKLDRNSEAVSSGEKLIT